MWEVMDAARDHTKGLIASSRPTAIRLRDAVRSLENYQHE